jgi:hypothetical protein
MIELEPCILRKNPDGSLAFVVTNSIEIPNKWRKNKITVAIIRGTKDLASDALEREIINLGLLTWSKEIGLQIIQVNAAENPDVIISFMPRSEDPYFAGDGSIIAWSGYPETSLQGQMHFNDDYRFSKDGAPIKAHDADPTHYPDPNDPTMFSTINLNQTFPHEFGHTLGFVHIETCPLCIMYPYYNGLLELQPIEVTRAVAKYGPNTKGMSWYQRISTWLKYRIRHE